MSCRRALALLAIPALSLLVLTAPSADALTLQFTGTVPVGGVAADFAPSPIGVGDAFTATISYDELTPVTDDAPALDLYVDALLAFAITFDTSSGPLTFSANNLVTPTSSNIAVLSASSFILQLADYDLDGTNPPLVGPTVPGTVGATATTFIPTALTLEISGDFSSALAGNLLPIGPFDSSPLRRVTVGMWGELPGGVVREANFEAVAGASPNPVPVPEPSTLLLLAAGVATLKARKR